MRSYATVGYTREQVLAALAGLPRLGPSEVRGICLSAAAAVGADHPQVSGLVGGRRLDGTHLRDRRPRRACRPRARERRSAYDKPALLAHLQASARETGHRARLTRADYDKWARQQLHRSTRGGVAHSETNRRRLGGWKQALDAEGVR